VTYQEVLQINKKARSEMKPSTWKISGLCVVILVCGAFSASAADSTANRAAIEKAVASYVKAFNDRDAKVLAGHWSPEGVYISRLSGDRIVGRKALEKEFSALFKEVKKAKLTVSTESIEFVSPNVALEQGTATVIKPGAEPVNSSYSVVYVKHGGRWLVDRISEEEELPAAPSHHEQLKGLDWLVGKWVDEGGGEVITTECKWTRNKNFLVRSFTASIAGHVDITGMQFVGWDPARKQIRSWVFDSDGGLAEGVWSQKGERWLVKTNATLSDGKTASSTSIIRPLGKDSFGWQKVNRTVDGELLPNIDEVVIVRGQQEE
jgi:uncharacterized protein (TIGR02246 family)